MLLTKMLLLAIAVTAVGFGTNLVFAEGEDADNVGPSPIFFGSILPVVTETGKISLSVDGLGMRATSGLMQVNKPAGATVRGAYFAAASTGFHNYTIPDGDMTVNGVAVNWGITTPSSISSRNHWADVTTHVKATLDAAPAGVVNITITETNEFNIDGSILAVIFDDPGQTTNNTVILLFGAQNIAGDTFNIGLAQPLDLSDPSLVIDMSLGISFGFQPIRPRQISRVDVNGTRMTSSAGGQDDCTTSPSASNGCLLTVGGWGDTNGNPPPFAAPTTPSDPDDELYSLLPFVSTGDTNIVVETINPSEDDNIFFSSLFLTNTIAVVGEGILLTPLTDTNDVGDTHEVTASVQNDDGDPIEGRDVDFKVVNGPHMGTMGSDTTDVNGVATFDYTGTAAGTDTIVATMTDSNGQLQTSNGVEKIWIADDEPVVEAPRCEVLGLIAGVLNVEVQSAVGLQSIDVLVADNATVGVPSFSAGDTSVITVTATKDNITLPATVEIKVTDVQGNVSTCDPVLVELDRSASSPRYSTYDAIPQVDRYFTISNTGESVITYALVNVNDKWFVMPTLLPYEIKTIDIGSALNAGDNTITIWGGGHGSQVMISDVMPTITNTFAYPDGMPY